MSFASNLIASASNASTSSSIGGLFRRSLKKCPHCQKPIDRCVIIEKLPDRFVLFCSACEQQFTEPKSEESLMTTGSRKYSRKEEVKSIDQIGVCDLIQYEVSVMGIKKENVAICTAKDKESKTMHVVKLTLSDEDVKVVENKVTEGTIIRNKAVAYRFMPLDCCSMDETVSRTKESVKDGDQDWLMTTIGEDLNFERFANWLKTGETKDLILRVREIISKCPTCAAPLYRSFRLSSQPLQLYCTVCRERYEVLDNKGQLAKLRHSYGGPYKSEKLSSVEQLGPADVFKRVVKGGAPVTHHFICTDVDRITNKISVIDLVGDADGIVQIQRYDLEFEELKDLTPQVDRYLPLDCLPGEETLQLAEKFVDGDSKWEPEKYNLAFNNCQHFVSFCKTGKKRSEDAISVGNFIASGAILSSVLVLGNQTRT